MITQMRTTLIVGIGLLAGLAGCDKGKDVTPPAGSAAATSGAAKASLTQTQLDEAYKLADPDSYDKSVTAVTTKLGAAQKSETDASIWYGVSKDGAGCYQLKLTKAKGHETGSVDKTNCGLK